MRAIGRRHVIEREKNPGDRLREKEKEQHRSEHVCPARAAGDRLVERFVQQRMNPSAPVEPVIKTLPGPSVRMNWFAAGLVRVSHCRSYESASFVGMS